MTIRQVLMFDNNPQAMAHLQENYAERRKIDKELGNSSSVRYFVAQIAGPNTGTMFIQYEYESLAQMEAEQTRRLENARWNELNDGLNAAGFSPTSHVITLETTPE